MKEDPNEALDPLLMKLRAFAKKFVDLLDMKEKKLEG
jgi:hypothetical protein